MTVLLVGFIDYLLYLFNYLNGLVLLIILLYLFDYLSGCYKK